MIYRFHLRALLATGLSLVLFAGSALADALVITQAMKASTIAEIYIEGDQLRIELEIGGADLPAFANLMPDEIYVQFGRDPLPLAERLPKFFREDLIIRADGGAPIPGRVMGMELRKRVVRDEVTGDPIAPAEGEAREDVLAVRFEYVLPDRPQQLTFDPPGDGRITSTTPSASPGFIVYHDGVAVNDFRYLSGEERLLLDWDDPWYSTFENRNLQRQYSAPAQGFIYVEPFEIRKEILIRPRDLQNWIDLGLEGKQVIAAEDQAALKAAVADFLGGRCPMTIDGEPADFEFDRIHFVKRTLRKTTVLEEPEDLPLASAMLGVIFVHVRDSLPQKAAMRWDLFNEKIASVRGATHDEAGAFPWTVTPENPDLEWVNYLKNPTLPTFVKLPPPPAAPRVEIPVVTVFCAALVTLGLVALLRGGKASPRWLRAGTVGVALAGAISWPFARVSLPVPLAQPPEISDGQATDLISGLLRNIYRAFDYRDEEAVYDSLARSVSGGLLTEIYIDVHKALVLQGQGGAKVKVDALEMIETDYLPGDNPAGFEIRCRWNVSGKVDHWGHVHTRTNEYEATFSVEAIDGEWKITGQEDGETKRVI